MQEGVRRCQGLSKVRMWKGLSGVARSCLESGHTRIARACQELTGGTRSCQEYKGVVLSCQGLSGVSKMCQELLKQKGVP